MPGLEFLTEIDTNRFGLQRPNLQEQERALPFKDRSTYRDALNRSLQETGPPRRVDPPNSTDLSERNRRPEITSSRTDEHRVESREHSIPSRPQATSADEAAHNDNSEIPAKRPQAVLDRLETNVAQIVPSLDDFPTPPQGLVESINSVVQIMLESGTDAVNDNVDLKLQIDLEEVPVAPESLLEAFGQFNGDTNLQNSTEISDVLADELHGPETLIRNEISPEISLQQPAKNNADSLSATNVAGIIVAQIPALETTEGLDIIQLAATAEMTASQSEPTTDILPVESLSEVIKSEELQKQEKADTSVSKDISKQETDSSTNQNLSTENGAFNQTKFSQSETYNSQSETNPTTIASVQTSDPLVQSSKQFAVNITDTSKTNSDKPTTDLPRNESPSLANLPSRAANRSETGQVASQASKEDPLPSPNAHLEAGTSNSNASTQSPNVSQSTSAAVRVAKNQHAMQLIDHVSQAVSVSQQAGKTMKFRLQPPELGTLQVEIRHDNGVLTARLEVHTEAALKAITHNITQLRDAIHQTGGHIEKIDVQLAESRNEHQPSNHSRQQSQEQRQNGNDRGQSGNRNSFGSENESGDENDTHLKTDSGEQVDIQV